MPEELRIRIQLGPNASIETVSTTVSDLAVVCEVGSELQLRVSRAELIQRILRDLGPGPYLDDLELFDYPPSKRWAAAALVAYRDPDYPTPPGLSRLLAANFEEYSADNEVVVRELRYSNPVDAHLILASGGVVFGLLIMIRDWSSNRRVRDALADDIEDEVQMRKALRRHIMQGVADGTIPIPEKWVETLLTDRSVRAFDRLSRRSVELPTVPEDGDSSS